MKFVYILEDDPKFQREIVEAIFSLDPKIQIRIFPKLENFVNWTKFMMTTGAKAIAQGGQIPTFIPKPEHIPPDDSHRLVLVVSKIEYLGVAQLGLLRRSQTLFVQRGLCTKEQPTSFVLTAFDDPNFSIKPLQDKILANVIFKPFDRLILAQHLTSAIEGHRPPSKSTVALQKTTAVLEMLKDVELEAVSDIGFISKSNREIPIGSVSKYYAKSFSSERKTSIFAISQKSTPHPDDPKFFRSVFTFFGAEQSQISIIRKTIRDKISKEFKLDGSGFPKGSQDRELNVVLLDEEENSQSGLMEQLPRRFQGIKVTAYDTFSAFISDLDPGQAIGERDPNLKALDGAITVTLSFDAGGQMYLGFESDKKSQSNLFGVAEKTLKAKTNWFSTALTPEHKDKFRKYVLTQKLLEDNVLSLTVGENPFLVKVTAVKKDGLKFLMTISELDKDQQIAWLGKNTRMNKKVHLIIASGRLFGEGATERWTHIKKTFKDKFSIDPVILITAKKAITDDEKRAWGTYANDAFAKPFDQVYLFQKIKSFFPQLRDKAEKTDVKARFVSEVVKAVAPVTVSEISEAGLTMQYYRPVTIGSFREIILIQPYEVGAPIILGTCNYVEENQVEKGTYNCQFIFFGVTDFSLKHIRIWMRDNYVLSKDPNAQ